jgi:FkbM family methyltransferase
MAFEPTPVSFARLKSRYGSVRNVSLFENAVADKAGPVTLNVHREAPTVSGLVKHTYGDDRDWTEALVEGVTLDGIAAQEVKPPDFLKLDTEGSELQILRGGESVLEAEVLGIYSEFHFWKADGQGARFSEIDEFLTARGFALFDLQLERGLSTVGGKKSRLNGGNALFIRDIYDLFERNSEITLSTMRQKVIKLLTIAVHYFYFDYALEIINVGESEGALEKDEARILSQELGKVTDVAHVLERLPLRHRLGALFDFLSWCCYPEARKSWPPMHNNIGNRRSALVRRRKASTAVVLHDPMRRRHEETCEQLEVRIS